MRSGRLAGGSCVMLVDEWERRSQLRLSTLGFDPAT